MLSKDFINFLNNYNFTKKELKEIENIIFYFYLGDYDIVEDYLKFKKGLLKEPVLDFTDSDKYFVDN